MKPILQLRYDLRKRNEKIKGNSTKGFIEKDDEN